jgi:predicted amidohydrolase YtcJ
MEPTPNGQIISFSAKGQAGTLRVGSFADFVVVDGDPLQLGTAPLEGESPTALLQS